VETFRNLVAWVGTQIIYLLIRVFGKRTGFQENPWLAGPLGSEYIGERPYEEVAKAEGLELERNACEGGLIPDFDALHCTGFDPADIHPAIRDFYEHTAQHRIDVWPHTYFPANLALWLLVTTISRKVNQLNFPTNALDMAMGVSSEIVLLKRADGSIKYTGWLRKFSGDRRVLYTGFYMVDVTPIRGTPVVKAVFPMPDGNATVVLRPKVGDYGAFLLESDGNEFGDVGFYRVQQHNGAPMRIWRVGSLRENFRVFVDEEGVVRCDHQVRYLGFNVLRLHYRIERIQ
jgi:hypothetical protein